MLCSRKPWHRLFKVTSKILLSKHEMERVGLLSEMQLNTIAHCLMENNHANILRFSCSQTADFGTVCPY